ncbi:hypothetical protein BsIDN1_14700 [Bacillus safensis]|uniref:DJ-1/PfpI domain-containing protein n=1 Tax=Bacillus safensis TaxID=561879 RepID=A0A5S9M572_BACIA|nr:hypothetical protein BsIDN1_14700 [Bacillus safensis]
MYPGIVCNVTIIKQEGFYMGKKIAVVLTDYFEDVEFTEPAKAFKDAGHEVTVIENEKKKNSEREARRSRSESGCVH